MPTAARCPCAKPRLPRLTYAALAACLLSACAPLATPAIQTTLEGERHALLRATAPMPRDVALAHLTRALAAPNPSVRAAAARVLGFNYFLDPPQLHALATALRDPAPDVRHAAALALLTQLPRLEAGAKASLLAHSSRLPRLPKTPVSGLPSEGASSLFSSTPTLTLARPAPNADPAALAREGNAATLDALGELRTLIEGQLRGVPPSPIGPDVHRILDQTHLGTSYPMPTGSMLPP